MAVLKLSQIVPAGSPPALGDQFVMVTGGVNDRLATGSQILTTLGIPAGSNTNVQYNASGALAGDSGLVYLTPNSLLINGNSQISIAGSPSVLQLSGNANNFWGAIQVAVGANTVGLGTVFAKTRGANASTQGAVVNGDLVMMLWAYASDGTAYGNCGQINVQVEGTVSTGIVPCRLTFGTPDSAGSFHERLRLDSAGNAVIGNAALATNATNGFFFIDSCPGVPTGVPAPPTTYTGRVPLVVDTTDNRLYGYNSGWQNLSGGAAAAAGNISYESTFAV